MNDWDSIPYGTPVADPVSSGDWDAIPFGNPVAVADEPNLEPVDSFGPLDEVRQFGRSLKSGLYRARQAANVLGMTDARKMDARVAQVQENWNAWEKANAGKTGQMIDRVRDRYKRGLEEAMAKADTTKALTGTMRENAGDIARDELKIRAISQSPAMREFQSGDWVKALASDPVEVAGSLMAESLPLSAPGMLAGTMLAGPAGTAAGAGAGSFTAEYATGILESLQSAGVDVTKPGWEDTMSEEQMTAASIHAVKRGVPIAILDALSGGLAGKILRPYIGKGVLKVAGASVGEAGMQAGLGMAGEAAAQVAAGQDLSMRDIVAEGIAEGPGAVFETAKNLQGPPGAQRSTPAEVAESEAIAKEFEGRPPARGLEATIHGPAAAAGAPDFSEFGTPVEESGTGPVSAPRQPVPEGETETPAAQQRHPSRPGAPEPDTRPATRADVQAIIEQYLPPQAIEDLRRRQQRSAPPEPEALPEPEPTPEVQVTRDMASDLEAAIRGNQLSPTPTTIPELSKSDIPKPVEVVDVPRARRMTALENEIQDLEATITSLSGLSRGPVFALRAKAEKYGLNDEEYATQLRAGVEKLTRSGAVEVIAERGQLQGTSDRPGPLSQAEIETPPDLAAAIEAEKTGIGPLSVEEKVELNELRITKKNRGRLGRLNSARLEHLESREANDPEPGQHQTPETAKPVEQKPLTDQDKADLQKELDEELGQFSTTPATGWESVTSPEQQGMSVEELSDHVASVTKGLPGAPEFVVLESIDQAPEPVRKAASRIKTGVRGFAHNGRAYLVASQITSPEAASNVLWHEALGHAGLRAAMGDNLKPFMEGVAKRYRGKPIFQQIADTYRLNPDTDAALIGEEIVARIAEGGIPDQTLWQRIVAAVREFARKLGFKGEVTENDIRAQLAKAARRMRGARKSAAGRAPRFSARSSDFIRRQDELIAKKSAAQRKGDTKAAAEIEGQIQALEREFSGGMDAGQQSIEDQLADETADSMRTTTPSMADTAPPMDPLAAPVSQSAAQKVDEITGATVSIETPEDKAERIARFFRRFATNTPEIALRGERAEKGSAFRRFVHQVNTQVPHVRSIAQKRVERILEPLTGLNRNVIDPNAYRKFQTITNKILRERAKGPKANQAKIEKLVAKQSALRDRLSESPMWLFNRAVVLRDLWFRGTQLTAPNGGPITMPNGLSIEEIEAAVAENQSAINANPHRAAIDEAIKRHYEVMDTLREEIEASGEIIPDDMRNPLYFPHHILDGYTGKLAPIRISTKEDFRGYLIDPTGTEKLHQADYIEALYKHVGDVMAHNKRIELVEKYVKPYDISSRVRKDTEAKAEAEGRTAHDREWRNPTNIPDGYTLFKPYGKVPLKLDWVIDRASLSAALGAEATQEDILQQIRQAGGSLKVTPDMLRQALVAVPEAEWVVPHDIADSLTEIEKREEARFGDPKNHPFEWAEKGSKHLLGLWKRQKLFLPQNWIRYEYGNTLTDIIDKVLVGDPKVFSYMGQAAKEILDVARGGEPSAHYSGALNEGVMQTITEHEAADLVKQKAFKSLRTDKQRAWDAFASMFTWTMKASQFRESVFRYAKFLADVERIEAGHPPVYGGAYHKDVEALKGTYPKAGMVSRRTFGDYGEMSVFGQTIREQLIPFYSWTEVNFKYHANLLRNLIDMVRAGDQQAARQAGRVAGAAATFSTRFAVGLAARMILVRGILEAWNNFGGPMMGLWDDDDDIERELSAEDRRRMHIVLGRDEKGRAKIIYTPNALGDVMEWVGGNNFARLMMEFAKGDIDLGTAAADFAKQLPNDTLNKVVQGIRPDAKAALTATTGYNMFPDVTDMRRVTEADKKWIVAGMLSDEPLVRAMRSHVDKDYYNTQSFGEWAQQAILQVRRRDPEQWAYYELREAADDWKFEKTGKRHEFGDYTAPAVQVARNFRRAIYNADLQSAEKFYGRLIELGYTSQRLKASIRGQHPLGSLTIQERKDFLAEWPQDDRQRNMLKNAFAFYDRLASVKGMEDELMSTDGNRFLPLVIERQPREDREQSRKNAEQLIKQSQ